MSTTIIFISPLDGPYTADIEMMIILLFCIYWLTGKSIPCILIFEHIPLKSVQNSAEESPNIQCVAALLIIDSIIRKHHPEKILNFYAI